MHNTTFYFDLYFIHVVASKWYGLMLKVVLALLMSAANWSHDILAIYHSNHSISDKLLKKLVESKYFSTSTFPFTTNRCYALAFYRPSKNVALKPKATMAFTFFLERQRWSIKLFNYMCLQMFHSPIIF